MKIVCLADIVPYPPNTGIKIRTYNVLRELHNNGENEVVLLAFNHRLLIPTDEELRQCVAKLEEICSEVHVFEIPSDRSRLTYYWQLFLSTVGRAPYRVKRYWSRECRARLGAVMAAGDVDILHLDKTEFFDYARSYPDTPCVCVNHNVESWLMQRRVPFETSLLRRFFAWLQYRRTERYEKLALEACDLYVTCTDVDRDYFANTLGIKGRHVTIENGVDTDHYYPVDDYPGDYVLIIGAQSKGSTKNFDSTHFFMREIWPEVSRRLPELRVRIVGRHPDASILAYGQADERVEVVGFVDDERREIAGAAALLVPLRLGGGSRLKILTAMSMSRCIVSTSIGAEGIECSSGTDILIADSAADFADAVVAVASDEGERRRLGQAARSRALATYDWRVIGRKMRKAYADLLE